MTSTSSAVDSSGGEAENAFSGRRPFRHAPATSSTSSAPAPRSSILHCGFGDGGGGHGAATNTTMSTTPSPTSSLTRSNSLRRRRSILGPPSLFPSQRGSEPGIILPGLELALKKKMLMQDQFDDVSVTTADLDFYYGLVKRQLLRYQSPTTGLFPEISGDTKEASIRASIYSNMAVWSLFQAYKRIDDDRGKSYELGQASVMGMRGILSCWMRQSDRLELFKSKQMPEHALHSKFNLDTGEELYTVEQYNHLQIDVVSLYLLFLVQIISSGLQVIYTMDEVCFVQNLVYYVERAYRTPDFGMWERGSKYNNGTCEVNASSIGFAKAALEAINGCNLFGDRGASWSVVYVDIDAHNRNRSIFETLLPRESSSKNVDAALIPTISFPAFATHDKELYEVTKTTCIEQLEGKYGFKRFKRDGYGTSGEQDLTLLQSRFYPEGSIQQFESVECEWPLFFAFMVVDGVFKQNEEQVEKYLERLRKRMCYNDIGENVQSKDVDLEKSHPGSRHRKASNNGCSTNDLFLWGQSMLIISDLLTTQLLQVHELDPIRRHLPSYNRPKMTNRYSAFEKGGGDDAPSSDLVVQVVTIAESMRLQAVLATYGIQTQTPNEIEPVQIWSHSEMVKVYQHLGRNESLGLRGRPARPLGALGTSKIYRMLGQTVICYPLIFSASEFYLSHDMALLTDDIKSELKFVSRSWRLSGRPTVCLIVTENNMRDPQFPVLLNLLAEFRSGCVDGVKVRLGRLQNLLASSCVEHLDFLHLVDPSVIGGKCFTQLQNEHVGYQTLTDIPVVRSTVEEPRDFVSEFKNKTSSEIALAITSCTHLYGSIQMLGILLQRESGDFRVGDLTVTNRLELLNRKAGASRHWAAVRYSSSLLKQTVDSISPFVTQLLVNGKQVTVGTIGKEYSLFDKPMTPSEIRQAIYARVQPYNIIAAVLQQELILYCGKLIATNPELFSGILKIRISWILYGLDLYKKMKEDNPEPIEKCSPSEIRRLLYRVLRESKALQLSFTEMDEVEIEAMSAGGKPVLTVYQVRQINGCLNRVPEQFYSDMWLILQRSPSGIFIGKNHLPQEPTLTQMASNEENFAHMVENFWNDFHEPEYKQLVVELFCVLARILQRNPELEFLEKLSADLLISEAIAMFKKDQGFSSDDKAAHVFYNTPVHTTSGYLARAVVNSILRGSMMRQDRGNVTDYNCPVQ